MAYNLRASVYRLETNCFVHGCLFLSSLNTFLFFNFLQVTKVNFSS